MSKAIPIVIALATIVCSACTRSVQVRERQRISAPQVGCPAAEIYITDRGTWSWTAECNRVIYECVVVSAREAECTRPGETPATATSGGNTSSGSAVITAEPAVESAEGAEVITAVNAQRDAILACVDAPPIGIAITLATDGTVSMRLTGPRAGTNQEACVRRVLAGLRLRAGPSAEETIIHVIR